MDMQPDVNAQLDNGADVSAKLELSTTLTDTDVQKLRVYVKQEAEWLRIARSNFDNLASFHAQLATADATDPRLTAVADAAAALAAGWTELPDALPGTDAK